MRPELDAVVAELGERAARAGVALRVVEGDASARAAGAAAHAAGRRAEPRRELDPLRRARARRSRSRSSRCDGGIVLRGSDDGVGVAEAELPRLFERFFRADRPRASRGTGLGLAIVKHVVTQAGGTVEARGGAGRGLEIRCVFPALRLMTSFTKKPPDVHMTGTHAASGRPGHWVAACPTPR